MQIYCIVIKRIFFFKWLLQVYITLTSLAVMFVPTLIIAICYITIVTVVWRKSSFTMSSRRSKAEDSCMELSTVVTKGQIKGFFSFNCIIYFQLFSAKNELRNIHGKSMVGTVHHLTHFYLKTWWIVTQNYRFFSCSLDKIILSN